MLLLSFIEQTPMDEEEPLILLPPDEGRLLLLDEDDELLVRRRAPLDNFIWLLLFSSLFFSMVFE